MDDKNEHSPHSIFSHVIQRASVNSYRDIEFARVVVRAFVGSLGSRS